MSHKPTITLERICQNICRRHWPNKISHQLHLFILSNINVKVNKNIMLMNSCCLAQCYIIKYFTFVLHHLIDWQLTISGWLWRSLTDLQQLPLSVTEGLWADDHVLTDIVGGVSGQDITPRELFLPCPWPVGWHALPHHGHCHLQAVHTGGVRAQHVIVKVTHLEQGRPQVNGIWNSGNS